MRVSRMFTPVILNQAMVNTPQIIQSPQVIPTIQSAPSLSYVQQPLTPTISQPIAKSMIQPIPKAIAPPTEYSMVPFITQSMIQPTLTQSIAPQPIGSSSMLRRSFTPSPPYYKFIPPTPITSTPLGINLPVNQFYQYTPNQTLRSSWSVIY